MTSGTQQLYEFGRFRIDRARRLLLRDGEVVPLTPKAFDLLSALVESCGEVVGKDELVRRVWPETFVEESSLSFNISVLRKALGGKASRHQYIVTVPGRGYRFVADVRPVGELPIGQGSGTTIEKNLLSTNGFQPPADVLEINRRALGGPLRLTLLVIASAAVAFGLYSIINRDRPAAPFQTMKIAPLATGGKVADSVISPDGNQLLCARGVETSDVVLITNFK